MLWKLILVRHVLSRIFPERSILINFVVNLLYYDVNMLRKLLMMAALLIAAVQSAAAQTGTWSGKLEVQD